MANQGGNLWIRNARLRVGGQPGGSIAGAYQYKFYYTGASPWPNDPLNHHVNHADNDNSFIIVRDPTFYHIVPNHGVVSTGTPTVTAFIYPKVGAAIDTSTLQIIIDGILYTGIGTSYNSSSKQLNYTVPSPLPNGTHTVILRAGTNAGGANADTVAFLTQAGYVQITTQGGFATRNPTRTVRGIVQNASVPIVRIVRNNTDTSVVTTLNGGYSAIVNLVEGLNSFKSLADSSGTLVPSAPVTFTYLVNHSPNASITFLDQGGSIQLQATGSTDPDPGQTPT